MCLWRQGKWGVCSHRLTRRWLSWGILDKGRAGLMPKDKEGHGLGGLAETIMLLQSGHSKA